MSPVTQTTNRNLSRSKKYNKNNKPWKKIVLLFAVVILAIASYYIYSIFNFAKDIQANPSDDSQNEKLPEWTGKERVNILLLGVDTRDGLDSTRSDSMLLLSLDPKTKQSQLFSIMRDTWVSIPGHKKQKINAAFALGGAKLTAKTVEQLLDIPVQYYVTTDLNGFSHIVDALGGVEINVEKDLHYVTKAEPELNIDLKAGLQRLNGKEALGYVRFRNDSAGDYGRSERQRTFLKALASEVQSTTGIIKIPSLLKTAEPYIETNMSMKDMLKIANLAYQTDAKSMQTILLPPEEFAKIDNGSVWRIIPDVDGLRKYVYETLNIEGTPALAKDSEKTTSSTPKTSEKESTKSTEAQAKPAPAPAPTPEPAPTESESGTDGTTEASQPTEGTTDGEQQATDGQQPTDGQQQTEGQSPSSDTNGNDQTGSEQQNEQQSTGSESQNQ